MMKTLVLIATLVSSQGYDPVAGARSLAFGATVLTKTKIEKNKAALRARLIQNANRLEATICPNGVAIVRETRALIEAGDDLKASTSAALAFEAAKNCKLKD